MENHPIPQQISSYQFRLVGDMTLKQFFQLAGGALVSLLFYSSNLPGIIKWPLIIFFALLGAALAFLPFQDRPLEKWIVAFFRTIYSPVCFYWQKIQKPPVFFQPEGTFLPTSEISQEELTKLNKQPIPGKQSRGIFDKLDEAEVLFLSKINSIFGPNTINNASAQNQNTEETAPQKPEPLTVPQTAPTKITSRIVVEEKAKDIYNPNISTTTVDPTFKSQENILEKEAQFSLDAAPPSPPTIPNTISGQVIDQEGKIIEGAILEVRDVSGRPVRALKSNRLGHFMVVTPLTNGRYEICTEKDGYSFESVFFDTQGVLIPPIAVKGSSQIVPITTEVPVATQANQESLPNQI